MITKLGECHQDALRGAGAPVSPVPGPRSDAARSAIRRGSMGRMTVRLLAPRLLATSDRRVHEQASYVRVHDCCYLFTIG